MLSIITPVYNGAQFIRKNIETIAQLKTPHEHIIVDGGSTDGTLEILNTYPHLIIVRQMKRDGMYGAIAQGFQLAKGDLITWINCDDYVFPEEYDKMVEIMDKSNACLIYSDSYMDYVQGDKKILSKSASCLPKYFIKHGILPFVQPSSIYTKTFYENIGGIDTIYKITSDMILFHKMACKKNAKFMKYSGVTVAFLKYGGSLGDKNGELGRRELEKAGVPKPNIIAKVLFKLMRMW